MRTGQQERGRALFDDSLASGPDAPPKYVAFGLELQGVRASGDTLRSTRGAQQVEIADLASAPAPPRFEMLVSAPAYANSLGARFSGPVTVRLERGRMSITSKRSAKNGPGYMMTFGTLLIVSGVLVFLVAAGLNAAVPPRRGQGRPGALRRQRWLPAHAPAVDSDRAHHDAGDGQALAPHEPARRHVASRSRQILILRTFSIADGALLQQAIARERWMWVR